MKKYLLTLVLVLLSTTCIGQLRGKLSTSLTGGLEYQMNGYRATLDSDIFEDLIFKDNKNNSVEFNKEYLSYTNFGTDVRTKTALFNSLIHRFKELNGYRETFSVDIFGDFNYKDNKGIQATLKKDIFENIIYSDSKGNNLTYSEGFIQQTYNKSASDSHFRFFVFNKLIHSLCAGAKPHLNTRPGGFNSPYPDDSLWGEPASDSGYDTGSNSLYQYKSKAEGWANIINDDLGNFIYQDSKGNDFLFSALTWQNRTRKYRSEENFFNYLVREYLRDN